MFRSGTTKCASDLNFNVTLKHVQQESQVKKKKLLAESLKAGKKLSKKASFI